MSLSGGAIWAFLTVLVTLGYVGGMQTAATLLGESWSTVPLFLANRPDGVGMRLVVQPLTWLCGSLLFTFVPGWPWVVLLRGRDRLLPFLCGALAASVFAQIVLGTLVKWLWGPLDRVAYTALLLAVILVGWTLVIIRRVPPPMPSLRRADLQWFGFACGVIGLLAVAFWGKLIHEDFNGDGIEAFELARSLVQHPFPVWDLEIQEGGFFSWHLTHPPLLAFLHLPSLLLFGLTEASVRGVFVFAWLCMMPLGWLLAETGTGASPRAAIRVLATLGLLPLVLNAFFYSGVDPFSELARCGEIVLLALALASLALLTQQHLALGVTFAVMASGIRWYGAVLMVVAIGLLSISDRRYRYALFALIGVLGAAGLGALLAGAATGHLAIAQAQFRYEHLGLLTGVPGYRAAPFAIAWHFLLFSGLLWPVVLMVRWQDSTARVLSGLCVIFVAFVAQSSLVANHYLTAAAYFPTLVVCRMLAGRVATPATRATWALCVCAVLIASVCLMPTRLQIHQASRMIGQETCLDARFYEEAVSLASTADIVGEDAGEPIGMHALAHYGRWVSVPDAGCTYFISTRRDFAPASAVRLTETSVGILSANPARRHLVRRRELSRKDAYYRLTSLRAVITGQ